MGPLAAALIVAAISAGSTIYAQKKAQQAQEAAEKEATDRTKFLQDLESKRVNQIANTAATGSRRRTALVKNPNAGQGPAGNTQAAQGTQGLTTSNGGVNPQAGNAGTF